MLKRSPLKWKSLRLLGAHVKICQIPYVNFETTSRFLSKFCIPLQFLKFLMSILKRKVDSSPNFVSLFSFVKDNSSAHFFWLKQYIFAQKESIKVKIFKTFECSGQNLSNSLYQFWNDKSIPLQILCSSSVSWKITPLYFFSSKNIYFA